MTNALILVLSGAVVFAGIAGYLLGRYGYRIAQIANEIRTVREEQAKAREEAEANKLPEPEKPQVTAGVYIPPEFTQRTNPRKAGLVEAKTPEQIEWERKRELEQLSNGG